MLVTSHYDCIITKMDCYMYIHGSQTLTIYALNNNYFIYLVVLWWTNSLWHSWFNVVHRDRDLIHDRQQRSPGALVAVLDSPQPSPSRPPVLLMKQCLVNSRQHEAFVKTLMVRTRETCADIDSARAQLHLVVHVHVYLTASA